MLPASTIKERAADLAKARQFFTDRGITEVDCCALSPHAAIDSNIDVIPAEVSAGQIGFLHTSPEYAMKRLLAAGSGDIFYLGHVFRQGEIGRFHNPEFTMAEWYRIGLSFDALIQETCDFISIFLGEHPIRKIGYREAFATYADIDYSRAPKEELLKKAQAYHASPDAANWTRDSLIHFLLTHAVEPHFGHNELTVLIDYPPYEAALARVIEQNGEKVAERFEIYHRSLELANGYHELPDGQELRRRFQKENAFRTLAGKSAYTLDEEFLNSLGPRFPDCCGVSVGFDRVLLLKNRADKLAEVLPFAWPI